MWKLEPELGISTDHSKGLQPGGTEVEDGRTVPRGIPDLLGPRAHQLSLSGLSLLRLAQFSRE